MDSGFQGLGGACKSSVLSFRNWGWLGYVLAPGLGFLVCRLGQLQPFLWVDVGIRRDAPTVEGAHCWASSKARLCRRRAPRRLTAGGRTLRLLAGCFRCGPRGARPLAAHGDFRHSSCGVLRNRSSHLLSAQRPPHSPSCPDAYLCSPSCSPFSSPVPARLTRPSCHP